MTKWLKAEARNDPAGTLMHFYDDSVVDVVERQTGRLLGHEAGPPKGRDISMAVYRDGDALYSRFYREVADADGVRLMPPSDMSPWPADGYEKLVAKAA